MKRTEGKMYQSPMGKVKLSSQVRTNGILKYQSPMGKVKKPRVIYPKRIYFVSIPYGKGKVSMKPIQKSGSQCINPLWER